MKYLLVGFLALGAGGFIYMGVKALWITTSTILRVPQTNIPWAVIAALIIAVAVLSTAVVLAFRTKLPLDN